MRTLILACTAIAATAHATPTTNHCRATPPLVAKELEAVFGRIAVAHDGTRIYVTRPFHSDVLVLSTADFSVLKTIPLGTGQPGAIAMRPDGLEVAVAINDRHSGRIVKIDPRSHAAKTHTLRDIGGYGIAYRPDGAELYMATKSMIWGLAADGTEAAEMRTQAVPDYASFSDVVFTLAAKGYAVVFQSDPDHNLAVFSTSTHSTTGYIDLGLGKVTPTNAVMANGATGSRLWVMDSSYGHVVLVDPATDQVTTRLSIKGDGMCTTPAGDVIVAGDSALSIYNSTGIQTRTIGPITKAHACAVSADGCSVFVTTRAGTVHKLDLKR